ncbi:MAG: polysaccharide export protein [Sphingomonas sp.]|uniref:polysaccharide biosynthesis/export family protein n=1 Tax=Sphingomonas sp. TaxID=28214 RepID=UPI001ACF8054|nr:polysaccharide biosynthesis/export family protein [Sphingomonas sp.]MBN8806905.1 polysaccharide export protein [Sphingomonas sp.]
MVVGVASTLPEPTSANIPIQNRPYLIGPYDSISVDVFGAKELSRSGMIDAAGNFSVPLVGDVRAAGLTTSQLATVITDRLRGRYVNNPQVSVQLTEARSQLVTVDGAVRQPGVYPVMGKTTLQQVIAMARGTDEYARLNEVVIFRDVDGKQFAALFSLKDIREGAMHDPEVFGNDKIIVGESLGRRIFKDTIQTLPAFGVFTLLR